MHKVIQLGVLVCILLVISVGVMTIVIIKEMTDIADDISKLNVLGYRNTVSVGISIFSRNLLSTYDIPNLTPDLEEAAKNLLSSF
jgi:hypothetical protein